MIYSLLADLVVVIHLGYVAYIVGGLVMILIGMRRRWRWIGNPWFRLTHLVGILFVVLEVILNTNCPLTTWERWLRNLAHQPVDGSAFMDRLMDFIFFGSAPSWVITGLYFVFAGAIALVFFCAPPRWRGSKAAAD